MGCFCFRARVPRSGDLSSNFFNSNSMHYFAISSSHLKQQRWIWDSQLENEFTVFSICVQRQHSMVFSLSDFMHFRLELSIRNARVISWSKNWEWIRRIKLQNGFFSFPLRKHSMLDFKKLKDYRFKVRQTIFLIFGVHLEFSILF